METNLGEGRGLLPTDLNLGREIAASSKVRKLKIKPKLAELLVTVVILSGEEPEERRDTLPVLRVVEVVAPPVEGPVLVGVVTRRVVLLLVALRQAPHGHRAHHPSHVNVGQTVGELVDVHVDAVNGVDGVLRVHLSSEPGFPGAEIES